MNTVATTTAAALRESLKVAEDLAAQIERLTDERETELRDIEQRAKLIANVKRTEHGSPVIGRTSEYVRFSHVSLDGSITFDVIDNYDAMHNGSFSLTLKQLADPDAAIAKIKETRARRERKSAETELRQAQERLVRAEARLRAETTDKG